MFQVKKSSYSRKIHKERKKHRSNEKSQSKNSNDYSQNNRGSSKDPSPPAAPPTTAKESNYIKEIQSDDGFSVRLLLFNFITIHKTHKSNINL
jgi:hypothetical protein